ncbi:MAG: TonB-dependent receptor [Flavobacteriaceae bacterium]|jgi:hypothetical protein|nr:TonB-dependent receptor [Flavobacteriaceae bacterium]
MRKTFAYHFILMMFLPVFSFAQKEEQDSINKIVEKQIEEVEIVANKKLIERKVDRLVFNVENSVSATGGDAIDALKITPGLRVQNDKISMIGRNTMLVMIDDRVVQLSGEELINYLKSIPADNIKSIEVITTPPAKYDAAGNSGLVNIILKKAKHDSWNTTLRSTYRQGMYESLSHGLGFGYKKNKFSVLADINYNYGKNLYTNEINYDYPAEHWNHNIFNRNHNKGLGTLLNLQYDISEKSSIGAQFLGSFFNFSSDEYNDNYSFDYINENLIKYYKTAGVSKTNSENISFNLNYDQKLDDKGKTFSVDADYFKNSSPQENNFDSVLQNYVLNTDDRQYATNNADQNIENYSLKTDFEMPFDWANLEFGAKATSTKTKYTVDANFYNADDDNLLSSQSDHFQYTENMQALYFSISKSFGTKWEAKIGLRGENTQTKANSVSTNEITDRNYFKLFPTAYISYKLNDDNTLSVDFGRRIQRPGFWELNPARWYSSPKSYVEGNPFMQPSFVYNFGINYTYKSLISFNLYYSDTQDGFGQTLYQDISDDSEVFKRENYFNQKGAGGSLALNYNPFKWWESNTNLDVYYSETKPFIPIYDKFYSGWGGSTNTTNTFTLNKSKTLYGTLVYQYNFPYLDGEGSGSSSLNLGFGVKYISKNKKLTAALNVNDIFKSDITIYYSTTNHIPGSFKQYYDTRLFRLSISYKFGNDKLSLNKREGGNEEEKQRAN